jgi:hypothetical protein
VLDANTGSRLDVLPTEALPVKLINNQTDRIYLATETGLIQCLHETELTQPLQHIQEPSQEPPAGESEPKPPGEPQPPPAQLPPPDDLQRPVAPDDNDQPDVEEGDDRGDVDDEDADGDARGPFGDNPFK